jgi:hypothetical protein
VRDSSTALGARERTWPDPGPATEWGSAAGTLPPRSAGPRCPNSILIVLLSALPTTSAGRFARGCNCCETNCRKLLMARLDLLPTAEAGGFPVRRHLGRLPRLTLHRLPTGPATAGPTAGARFARPAIPRSRMFNAACAAECWSEPQGPSTRTSLASSCCPKTSTLSSSVGSVGSVGSTRTRGRIRIRRAVRLIRPMIRLPDAFVGSIAMAKSDHSKFESRL